MDLIANASPHRVNSQQVMTEQTGSAIQNSSFSSDSGEGRSIDYSQQHKDDGSDAFMGH